MLIMLVTTKKRDNVKIIRIVLDLHDAIVHWALGVAMKLTFL